ncbi:MAG: HNH endonuclease [Solirubrobacterales bacterium]
MLDAYGSACAVTSEHALPVLEAGHIRPWHLGGPHEVSNGLPLRRDLHRLFDLGFVTVDERLGLEVSPALMDDYANGRVYYEMAGQPLHTPSDPAAKPNPEHLAWHREEVFRA